MDATIILTIKSESGAINAGPCRAGERVPSLVRRPIRPASAARPPPGPDMTGNARFRV